MELVLFEPDIPQNTGSFVRLTACLGVPLHIIEPCGFIVDDKRLKRSAMDYYALAEIIRHASWQAFQEFRAARKAARLILLSAHAPCPYTSFAFAPGDMLLLGRESAGVPETVKTAADAAITIPMQPGARSLNVTLAGAMVLGEGLRQIRCI